MPGQRRVSSIHRETGFTARKSWFKENNFRKMLSIYIKEAATALLLE